MSDKLNVPHPSDPKCGQPAAQAKPSVTSRSGSAAPSASNNSPAASAASNSVAFGPFSAPERSVGFAAATSAAPALARSSFTAAETFSYPGGSYGVASSVMNYRSVELQVSPLRNDSFSISKPLQESVVGITRAIIAISVLMILVSFVFLRGTPLGFAMTFGAVVVGYEAYHIRRARQKSLDPNRVDVARIA